MSLSCRNWLRFCAAKIPKACGLLVLVLVATDAVELHGEDRKYVVGTTVDFVSGGNGQSAAGIGVTDGSNQASSFFYEVYPSIQMRSTGEHSTLEVSYAFGFSRVSSGLNYNSNSQAVSTKLSTSLSPKWKVSLSDSFQMTSNFMTFNTTRGVTSSPDGFHFLFNPVTINQSSQSNNATITADYARNEKSTLSVSGSYSVLKYPQQTLLGGSLSDQQRISESITYSQRTTQRDTWSVAYATGYLNFQQFENAVSHTFSGGYSRQIRPTLTVRFTAGPTYVQTPGSGPAGSYKSYNTQVTVQKLIKANPFSFYYGHDSGETSGLGSISDNDRVGFNTSRIIGNNANLFVDVSAFNARGRLGNPYSARGMSAAVTLGVPLTRMLSLQWGGQYQHYSQTSLFGFEQKRIYVSLKINAPELWKLSR